MNTRPDDVRIGLLDVECRRFDELVSATAVSAQLPKRKLATGDGKDNEDTEERPQRRKYSNLTAATLPKISVGELVIVEAIHILLPMLLDVYAELNGIMVRLKTIEAIQRSVAIIYCALS